MYYRPGPLVHLYYCYNIIKPRPFAQQRPYNLRVPSKQTMYNVLTAPVESTKCNGYQNYQTWNIALHIQNNERLYKLSQWCDSYAEFIYELGVSGTNKVWTPDGVSFEDRKLNIAELDELFQVED